MSREKNQMKRMDDRANELLNVLIERYIADGQPVASRTLSKLFDLSPATIRNVMADLEQLGLIHSPHTSAGRIPTPQGYRLFVDRLLAVQHFNRPTLEPIVLNWPIDEPSKAVNSAAGLLSHLSQFAGVVLAPKRSQTFQHIEFIRLAEKRVLLIIVTPDGDVQNRILFMQREYQTAELQEASNFFNQHFSGKSFSEVRRSMAAELSSLQADISSLMQAAVDVSASVTSQHETVVISGESKLLDVDEITTDKSRLRSLFQLFDKKTDLLHLLDASSQAQGVQIYIGGDSQLMPLEEVSVVTAPYGVDGEVVGTLGVVGPSRMAYDKVIPIVDITAKLLSNALSYSPH